MASEAEDIDEAQGRDPTEKILRAIFGSGSPSTGTAGLDTRLSAIETRITAADTRLGLVETRLAVVETKLGNLEAGLTRIEGGVAKLQENARTDFRLLFGALIATALGLAGMMAKGFHWF